MKPIDKKEDSKPEIKARKKSKDLLKVKLTDDQKLRAREEIESGLAQIIKERADLGLEDKWDARKDLYRGEKERRDFPWEDSANYHIDFASMVIDTLTVKAKRQTIQDPIVLLQPKQELLNKVGFADRERALDYRLRTLTKFEEWISPVYRQAAIQGTAFTKVPLHEEKDDRVIVKTYKGDEGAEKYKWDFRNKPKKYDDNEVKTLQDGGTVTKAVSEAVTTFYGPKPYRVKIEDLFIRPSLFNIRDNRVIAERMRFNWSEIQKRARVGFYDKKAVETLKEQKGKHYRREDYTFYECILHTDLEKEGLYRRYIITLEDSTREIVRAIHYPYEHGKIHYIPWRIILNDDSVYGDSLIDRIADENAIMDNLWNSSLDLAALRANPPKQISDMSARVKETKWGPGAIYKTPRGLDTLKMLTMDPFQLDSQRLIHIAQRMGEQSSGISAGMSGKENPLDPRAPAAKTAMLLREGNIRVEDYVLELLKSVSELAEQVEKLDLQYEPEREIYTKYGEKVTVEEAISDMEVIYKPQGAVTTINKSLELSMITEFMGMAPEMWPEIMQSPLVRRHLLQLTLEAFGTSLGRNKEKIMQALPGKEKLQKQLLMRLRQALQSESPDAIGKIREMLKSNLDAKSEIDDMDMSGSNLGGLSE